MAKKILEVRDGWPYGKEKKYSKKTVASGCSKSQSEEMQSLQEQVRHLQFEVDVLKEALAVSALANLLKPTGPACRLKIVRFHEEVRQDSCVFLFNG